MLDINNVKKYVARFLYEERIYGEDPLEYSVEQPLIDCIHMLKWLHSLGIYTEESLKIAIDRANSALDYMDRPCFDGCDFQSDEHGVFIDFNCEDDDKALEIAYIIFSTYLAINFPEVKVVERFFNNAYNYDEEFRDYKTSEEFENFFNTSFDKDKFYPEEYIKKVDFSVLKEWNTTVYENWIKLFD